MQIGIITPVYNGEKTILRSIKSVDINIRKVPFKCIHYIYDDGSTDNTVDVILSYSDSSVLLTRSNENNGQSYARNKLIQSAIKDGCTHIAFIDADDEWYEELLLSYYPLFKLNNVDVVYGYPEIISDSGDNIEPWFPVPKIFIGKHLEHGNFIWISGVVAKIDCFIDNSFDSNLDSLEDYDMWLRLYRQGFKFLSIEKKTFKYYMSSSSEAGKGDRVLEKLREKNGPSLQRLRLNLACGFDIQEGYINSDLYPQKGVKVDAVIDVEKVPYNDNSVDEVRSLHVIEHFHFHDTVVVLKEWYRVLKPGGKLIIETPDFLNSCKRFVDDPDIRVQLYGHFFAMPWEPGQVHKFLFTEEQLVLHLSWAGFKNMRRINPVSNYVNPNTVDNFLAMEAYK